MRIQQFISTISNNREYFSYLKRRMYIWSHNFFFGVGWIHWGPRDNFFFGDSGGGDSNRHIFGNFTL